MGRYDGVCSAKRTGDADVFVPHSVIGGFGFKTLDEGDSVSFEVEPGANGAAAKNVVRLQLETV